MQSAALAARFTARSSTSRLSNYFPRHIMVLSFYRPYTIKLAHSRLPLYLFQSESITVTLVRHIESSLSYSHELDFTLPLRSPHPVYGISKSTSCSTHARTTSSSSTPKSNSSQYLIALRRLRVAACSAQASSAYPRLCRIPLASVP
jgi:hypothetical protein